MEAAIRSVQQVGPPGQRADTGPSPQPPPTMSFQQRVPPGAAQIHRSVDTVQVYSKGGPPQSQTASRSAASPLSPPRPGPGASAANYPPFAGAPAREAPLRYVQNNSYYRENPYTRVSQVPQMPEYHRQVPVVSVSSSIPASISIANSMEPVQQQSTRPRISLLPHNPDYLQQRVMQQQQQSDTGPPAFKKIRLNENSQPAQSLLNVDTRDPPASSGAYHPQVEAISPTLPSDPTEELRATKDDLLQQIAKVDIEIDKAEKTIAMLKKKQETLEEASAKPAVEESAAETQPKHRNLAQQIYADNRKRAATTHAVLSALGTATDLPLYNQPSDAEICREIQERHKTFKQHLLLHFKRIKSERAAKQIELTERYAQLSQDWSKRVDKMEASAKRKAKDAKNREFFEKVFPELRKQREDKERFNRVGSRIKSEADLEEIMDGLQEQAMEDKKMRSYAVIPPLMLDSRQRRLVFNNENGALIDMETEFKERLNLNVWTAGEKEIFREKFLQHPKNFGMIAASLDRKSAQDCVRYYYLSKKAENYKQLLRKSRQRTRSSRNIQKSNQNQTQCIVDALTTGVTTRLQREQQQKTVGRDRAANSTNSSIGNSSASNVTTNSSSNNTNNNNSSSNNSSSSASSINASTSISSAVPASTTIATANSVATAPVSSTASPPPVTTTATIATSISSSTCTNISSSSSTSSSVNNANSSVANSSPAANGGEGSESVVKDEAGKEKQSTGSDSPAASLPGVTNTSITTTTTTTSPTSDDSTTLLTTTPTTATVSTNSPLATVCSPRSSTPSSVLTASVTSSSSPAPSTPSSSTVQLSCSTAHTTQSTPSNATPLSVSSSIISSSSTLTTGVGVSVSNSNNIGSVINSNSSSNNNSNNGILSGVTTVETSFVPNLSSSISTIPLNGVKTEVLSSTTATVTTSVTSLNNSYCTNNSINASVNSVNSTMASSVAVSSGMAMTHSASVPVTLAAAAPGKINLSTAMSPSYQPQVHLQPLQTHPNSVMFKGTTTLSNLTGASSMDIIIKDITLGSVVASVVNSKLGVKDNLLKEDLEPSESKKRRVDLDGVKDDGVSQENKDKGSALHSCFVCKAEMCPRTRPLERGRGAQYGIPEEAIPPGARVCNTCQCKSVKSRYTHCPLPTCPNPKDRVKRFRNLPPRLFELSVDIRDPIIQELQIPPNVTKCCSACLTRIRRKMGPHLLGTNLTEEEVTRMKKLLQDVGPKWNHLSETLNKTPVALKSFYFHYKKKYGFDLALTEYYKQHPGEDRRAAMTDGDESDMSTSSSDERDGSSDTTASAESPNNSVPCNATKEEIITVSETLAPPPLTKNFEDDRLLPPGQPPRKQRLTEEYDSSATETADEENETSPANRQSPKVLYPPLGSVNPVISVHHTSLQNGPRGNDVSSPQNVRDVVLNVIERSLKSSMMPSSTKPPPMKSINDLSFGPRDYRDMSKSGSFQRPPPEGMATLSVVNSHGHAQSPIISHPISSQIQATITPVPQQTPQSLAQNQQIQPSLQQQQQAMQSQSQGMHPSQQQQPPQQQQPISSSGHEKDISVVYLREEPQTLDLSIKKHQRDNFPPPAHNSKLPTSASSQPTPPPPHSSSSSSTVTVYRSDNFPPPSHQQQNIPSHGAPYGLSYHDSMGRPTKSPSGYITTAPGGPPISLSQGPGGLSSQPSSVVGRGGQIPQQTISLTPPPVKKQQNVPKLSPKMQHQVQSAMQQPPPQSLGPKGSITHGTPVNSAGQQIIVPGQTTLSPRYDNILRQTPPSSNDKHGSITQGTPVHMSAHALPDKRAAYEYKSYNNRQSPAQVSQPPTQGSPQAPQFTYTRTAPSFTLEPQQLSSRQIIMNDYITSQQMQGRSAAGSAGSRPEKESPSPRSVPNIANSPAALLYAVAERERNSRPEYLSRASPADHVNRGSPVFSTPSPHRTPPPPQRQGVIQRHNTGGASGGNTGNAGSKPPSPAPSRLHPVPPPHHYMQGHDAFTSLVDLAVQQQPMTVPHKDDKRQLIEQQQGPPPPPTSHDIRYHQATMIQIHHQQQQQQQQAAAAAAAAAVAQHQQQQQQQHAAAVAVQQQHAAAAAAAQHQQQAFQRQQQMDLQRRQQSQMHPSLQHPSVVAYREQQMERDREINYRERMERERMVERERERQIEREQRERDQREREREREREQREQRDRQQRERDRERLAHQEEEERRRKHYDIISERIDRPMETLGMRQSSDGSLTAANLIDAIITHQINQTASEPPLPPNRDMHRPPYFPSRDHRPSPLSENNGKSHSPNVINIDVDSEPVRTKNITIGELAESIIAKDYSPNPNPFLQMRPSMIPMSLETSIMSASDAWKYRRIPSGKEEQLSHSQPPPSPSQQQQQVQMQVQQQGIPGHPQYVHPQQQSNKGPGRSTPDDRHIIRMAQSPGPRNKFHDSVSPDTHFFHPGAPLSRGSRDFALDCYVKNRIVEAMRTEDDKRVDDGRDLQSPRNQSPAQHGPPPPAHHNKDHDRSSTPADMMIDEETGRPASVGNPHRPPSSSQQQLPPHSQSQQGGIHNSLHSSPYIGGQSGPPPPVTTFAPQTYYPYSALTVSGGPVVGGLGPPVHPPKTTLIVPTLGGGSVGVGGGSGMNMNDDRQSSSSSNTIEPKPLLSAQYEALSDED
ncbi:nuclear receptor corepressor 1 isoform X2 [Wyeomyia smithii]|uniref:nuclear receptor corepressor 1 isoform X2 n=1 Tax=Wyeomyia smithii TaxID=174621 RepID=UPI002467C75B|nr:nuclear receptor corepressor 1 isoform X2 [Wyeomyia smithii]